MYDDLKRANTILRPRYPILWYDIDLLCHIKLATSCRSNRNPGLDLDLWGKGFNSNSRRNRLNCNDVRVLEHIQSIRRNLRKSVHQSKSQRTNIQDRPTRTLFCDSRTVLRIDKLPTINNLVASLRRKLAAKLLLKNSSTTDILYPAELLCTRTTNRCQSPTKENEVHFPLTENSSTNIRSDFSNIVDDVDSLEKFLKVIAPMFMKNILTTNQQTDSDNADSDNEVADEKREKNSNPVNGHLVTSKQDPSSIIATGNETDSIATGNATEIVHINLLEPTCCPDQNSNKNSSTSETLSQCMNESIAHVDNSPCETASGAKSKVRAITDGESVSDQVPNSLQVNISHDQSTPVQNCMYDCISIPQHSQVYPTFEELYETDVEINESIASAMAEELIMKTNDQVAAELTKRHVELASTGSPSHSHCCSLFDVVIDTSNSARQTSTETPEVQSQQQSCLSANEKQRKGLPPDLSFEKSLVPPLLGVRLSTSNQACSLDARGFGKHQTMATPLDFNLNALYKSLSEDQSARGENTTKPIQNSKMKQTFSSPVTYDTRPFDHQNNGEERSYLNSRTPSTKSDCQSVKSQLSEESGTTMRSSGNSSNAVPCKYETTRKVESNNGTPSSLSSFAIAFIGMCFGYLCSTSAISGIPWWIIVTAPLGCLLLIAKLQHGFPLSSLGKAVSNKWLEFIAYLENKNGCQAEDETKRNYALQRENSDNRQIQEDAKANYMHCINHSALPVPVNQAETERSAELFQNQAMTISSHETSTHTLLNNALLETVNNSSNALDGTEISDDWQIKGSHTDTMEIPGVSSQTVTTTSLSTLLGATIQDTTLLGSTSRIFTGSPDAPSQHTPIFAPAVTSSVYTGTEDLECESVFDVGSQQCDMETCMTATMTESQDKTSSVCQTDGAGIIYHDNQVKGFLEEMSGETLEIVEAKPLSQMTVETASQADIGARWLTQKTEKLKRHSKVSIRRLRRKFLYIRRRCQMEAQALKQCNKQKNEFLSRLQLSLPALQQEKRSLLAQQAMIEKQFEDEKKKNRELVSRLTRLNQQFSKFGQNQHAPSVAQQRWRQTQQTQQSQQQTVYVNRSSNSTCTETNGTIGNTPSGCPQTYTLNDSYSFQRQNMQQHQHQQPQTGRVSSGVVHSSATVIGQQSKGGKYTSTVSTSYHPQASSKVQQQSTLLQTNQVRPNNAAPTVPISTGHAYQDQTHQRTFEQQALQQQQRLPIFQLFNKPGKVQAEIPSANQHENDNN